MHDGTPGQKNMSVGMYRLKRTDKLVLKCSDFHCKFANIVKVVSQLVLLKLSVYLKFQLPWNNEQCSKLKILLNALKLQLRGITLCIILSAPEVLKQKPYGKAVDCWAVGVICYIL